jgi:Peptidase family M23
MRTFLTAALAVAAFLALTRTASAEWAWPLRGQVITTYRNVDDPYAGGQHRGIDIAGQVGARVVAAAGGEIRFARMAGSSGLTVSVRTTDGFDTSYLHLSSVSVHEGQLVSSGDALGAVGVTGSRSASEPHLHFGVREAGTRHSYRNPLDFLPPPQAPPSPEAPHPAPGPAPVPAPLAPRPAPAGEPAPRRIPLGGRTPRRVPTGGRSPRRVPAGGRAPGHVPAGEPVSRPVPAERRVPLARPAPGAAPAPASEPASRPDPVPETPSRPVPRADHAVREFPGPHSPRDVRAGVRAARGTSELPRLGPRPAPAPVPSGSRAPGARSAVSAGSSAPGPDIGWILACVGLLLAAALLGLTEDGRNVSRKGGRHLGRLLAPLTGRG